MRDSVTNELQVELAELQRLVAAQACEIATLRADVRRIERGAAGEVDASPTSDLAAEENRSGPGPTVSRRAFARLGVMASVGAAAAVAGLGADASPAAAAEGSAVLLGKDNGGATARTGIFAPGASLYATLADPAVDIGKQPLDNQPFTAGVVGKGTVGVLGAGLNETGAGIYATDSAINASAPDGSGLCTGVAAWLQGPANESSAIYAQSDGLGDGLTVLLTSPSNQQPAIRAVNEGSGPGLFVTDGYGIKGFLVTDNAVRRTAGSGPGLVAQLTNPDNLSAAVAAHTVGPGPGLEASATSGAAVSASSTTGPAAQFSSPVAQLRLKPGPSDHPKEGETGDFFVDAAGHLWFCKDPGTWAKLV